MNRKVAACDLDVDRATARTDKNELSLTGVANWPKTAKAERLLQGGKTVDLDGDVPQLDCGCSTEDCVVHFWLWKNWRLEGLDEAVIEPMNAAHIIPRVRNVMRQGLRYWAGLRMERLLPGKLITSDEAREIMLRQQIRTLTASLGRYVRERGEPFDERAMWDVVGEKLDATGAPVAGASTSAT